MMPMIGVLMVLLLVGAWLFDRYRRRTRGLAGEVDDYGPAKGTGPHWTPMGDQHHQGGFGG